MIRAIINNLPVQVPHGTTILDAARQVSVRIPTLCKHPDLDATARGAATASCGICSVRIKGVSKMVRACCTPIESGMKITTEDSEIIQVRRTVLEMILAEHPQECLTCIRNENCELRALTADFGLCRNGLDNIVPALKPDASTRSITLDPRKCISCMRCTQVCPHILQHDNETRVTADGNVPLADSACVRCGQCAAHCPTGAIVEYDETARVWEKLHDPEAYCVAQIAPAVRVALGEPFGFPPGANLTGKIYAALRRMGFKAVFDTNFAADLTIMEEASEFAERFLHGKSVLPLFTSCCPGWVDFVRQSQNDMIPHLSSCKSPHAMLGALAKTYYAQKLKLDPAKMFVVSVMPCTAKKSEITRSREMSSSGFQDVDVTLTTRELARMIKQSGVDFRTVPEAEPDLLLGAYTGAGTIFGATGGVMEAALRTAHHLVTGKNLARVEFQMTRGLTGVKEGEVKIAGKAIRVAVTHGFGNVKQVLDRVRAARDSGREPPYHFIEVMACPGGCVGGGGQPYGVTDELRKQRAAGLYQEDHAGKLRCSHQNPYVQQLYQEFLGEPLGHESERLLHTTYEPRTVHSRCTSSTNQTAPVAGPAA